MLSAGPDNEHKAAASRQHGTLLPCLELLPHSFAISFAAGIDVTAGSLGRRLLVQLVRSPHQLYTMRAPHRSRLFQLEIC